VLREGIERFPAAFLDDQAIEIRLLCDHREILVAERRRLINRLRWNSWSSTPSTRDLCSPRATEVPQRQLRNDTASLLRRVQAGERLRITVHGHPVAELVPVERAHPFVPFDEVVNELQGTMLAEDPLAEELRKLDETARDPFA
jgi:prevent-host-death family protein